jgi:uncharacterized lipoprotein YddW (UPF0748 family)
MIKKIAFFFALFYSFNGFAAQTNAKAIRGVWVPAPSHTNVLHTFENVQKFVETLDSLNFNAIFLVSYAESKAIYQSKVIQKYAGLNDIGQTSLLSPYLKNYNQPLKSPTSDPVADLIKLAHQRNIKVFFWYEYGFMGDTKPITTSNPLFANNPSWLGIRNNGEPAAYNKDFYFNAYDPSVQTYLIKLIQEGIRLYPDIDGIQGDDRMPAMPKNSGYDEVTVARYKAVHNGSLPPQNFNDEDWVNWRLNILNDFGKKLYQAAHQVKKNIIVSFAPNPYPWSKDNLMQDWPTWLSQNNCDLLAVQCYRYSADAYKNTVAAVLSHVNKANPNQLFAPGIILMEGRKIKMTPDLLKEQIRINRSLGINSEIFFYNDALKNSEIKQAFLELYTQKVDFPR